MVITFVSNFLNIHISPICLELSRRENIDFCFIALETFSDERKRMCFSDYNEKYSFVLKAYSSSKNYDKAISRIHKSDVVIIGSAPDRFTETSIRSGAFVFKSCERFYKRGTFIRFWPNSFLKKYKGILKYKNKNLYFLCNSAYLSYDLHLIGFPKSKCFKWGYFPELTSHTWNQLNQIKVGNTTVQLLWMGRMIDWKEVLRCVTLAVYLKNKGYDFMITVIGEGPQETELKARIAQEKLQQDIKILKFVPPEKAKEYMDHTDIYLFTSNYQEGWGAVLNEAMGSACAVVASTAAGATPYLVQNEINGLSYVWNDEVEFCKQAEKLVKDKSLRCKLGKAAYETVHGLWSSETAANHLILFIESLVGHTDALVLEGPCSQAEVRKDKNFWGILEQKRTK